MSDAAFTETIVLFSMFGCHMDATPPDFPIGHVLLLSVGTMVVWRRLEVAPARRFVWSCLFTVDERRAETRRLVDLFVLHHHSSRTSLSSITSSVHSRHFLLALSSVNEGSARRFFAPLHRNRCSRGFKASASPTFRGRRSSCFV